LHAPLGIERHRALQAVICSSQLKNQVFACSPILRVAAGSLIILALLKLLCNIRSSPEVQKSITARAVVLFLCTLLWESNGIALCKPLFVIRS